MNQCADKPTSTPPLLMPPKAAVHKKVKFPLQEILCVLCAILAATVLALSAFQWIRGVSKQGFVGYVADFLLGDSKSVSESTFGSPLAIKPQGDRETGAFLALPRIYYLPKESIIDNSIAKTRELEKKMFELYAFDYSKVPSDAYPIIPSDLSATSPAALKNDTTYKIDMSEIEKSAAMLACEEVTDEPLVLIVHTHGTESFSEKNSPFYKDDFNVPRSEDLSKNVIAVGKALAEALNKKGIPSIQCEIMHDKDSYISAYERSAESIKEYLEKYPSIRYVFDVHRDSLIQSDLTKLRPVTLHNERPCAQIMMIVGTNEKSGIDYDWEANLVLAEAIQKHLFTDTLGVARQLYLRGATYNQQYANYGILLEIGSCGNTLDEAKNAALAFADAFAKTLGK